MISVVRTSLAKITTFVAPLKYLAGFLLLSLSLHCNAFGTLFTSPEQREALDRQRAQGETFSAEPTTSIQTKVSPDVVSTSAQQIFFNGYVIRKSGPNTAWANQKTLPKTDKNKFQHEVSAGLNDIKGTSVPIKTSALSSSTRLKPGQLLNKNTGEITEGYQIKRSIPEAKKSNAVPSSADTIDHQKPDSEAETEQTENKSTEPE